MGDDFPHYGGVACVPYTLALRVIAMGDANAVNVANEVHRAILQSQGGLDETEELIYGKIFPSSRTLEGCYIDDHFVLAILPNHLLEKPGGRDHDLIRASWLAYSKAGLSRAPEKRLWVLRSG